MEKDFKTLNNKMKRQLTKPKFKLIKDKSKLLKYWFLDKKGFGIKKTQLNLDLKKSRISQILRLLRKEGKIIYRSKRWFLTDKTYLGLKTDKIKFEKFKKEVGRRN